ncbi:Reticulon-domain-containing protein [Calycina marina]|uniref:Reticulon-like protein n=1 Tax=Calycina marina TaxID=1763456 RepID=A0A9P7YWM9_9HELO|nr:Reticulon-domain-containing protein [Calycina marina]
MSNAEDIGVIPSIENDTTGNVSGATSNTPAFDNSKANVVNNASAAANAMSTNASAAANAVKNHPFTQDLANGPVVANIQEQSAKTSTEFSDLAASRQTPSTPAVTGQQLTHYHSFFSRLLSWDHPRASGIAYASIVLFIFAARYLNILRYALKLTYMTLAVTVIAEVAGKAIFSKGLTSQIRPRKYYTVPKESIDRLTSDFSELLNFFVIESQRIVFAENVFASVCAFLGAFLSYFLIKIVPFWGLSLLSATILFVAPLIYKTNKELIDEQIAQASAIVNQQTQQVRELASHHAARAADTTKAYASDYSTKAQDLISSARGRSSSPAVEKKPVSPQPISPTLKESFPVGSSLNNTSAFKSEDFPSAPKEEFKTNPVAEEPLII